MLGCSQVIPVGTWGWPCLGLQTWVLRRALPSPIQHSSSVRSCLSTPDSVHGAAVTHLQEIQGTSAEAGTEPAIVLKPS